MNDKSQVEAIVEQLQQGDRRAIARAITLVENRMPEAETILRGIYPKTGRAYVVGVTGSPGVGKSTLVSELIKGYRNRDCKVGVIAIDPSSPFSGGAILGDRVRLATGPRDHNVFFRSLGNRGHTGGVSRATQEVIHILDAAGFDVIILETVGAGQSEVDVMQFAHTVLVVTVPGLGDDVQAAKAGILEIGDVFVVNKADREGADRAAADLQAMLSLVEAEEGAWRPPVVKTIAQAGEGIDELIDAIERHRAYLQANDVLKQRRRALAEKQLTTIMTERLLAALQAVADGSWQAAMTAIEQRRATPMQAAEQHLLQADVLSSVLERMQQAAPRGEEA